ncbi:MAG: hypothetical protein H6Q05_3206 [Acidobacteria bacterium]|nr:hypothetical protein [Acidobacteriota bacterium]
MTKLLAQAFDKAAELPEDLQDHLARELPEEIEEESRWDATLAASLEKLERLAGRAAEEYRMGKNIKKGFDELVEIACEACSTLRCAGGY